MRPMRKLACGGVEGSRLPCQQLPRRAERAFSGGLWLSCPACRGCGGTMKAQPRDLVGPQGARAMETHAERRPLME